MIQEAKRVLFVTSGLATGGAEVVLVDLMSQLEARGCTVSVINLKDRGSQYERISRMGVDVLQIDHSSVISSLMSIAKTIKGAKSFRPDVIQGWMYHGNLAASLLALVFAMKPYWSIHHSVVNINFEKKSLQRLISLLKLLSCHPKGIHYCSSTSSKQHELLGFAAKKSFIVPNGVDIQKFTGNRLKGQELRAKLGLEEESIVVGHIARFHPMKDHLNFIEAAGRLTKMTSNVKFLMVGKGVDQKNSTIMQALSSSNLEDHFLLLGERLDIPDLMSTLNVFSTSSAWGEAFPIVLAEAMASGVPCVATDLGDCAWLIGETGIIVPPRDSDALSRAWQTIIQEGVEGREERGIRARDRIRNLFTLDVMADKFMHAYSE